jgi:subtilisin
MAERRSATTTTTERRSVIVTFKRKDQRPDRTTDKVDIVRSALTQGVQPQFLNATTLPLGAARPPLEPQLVGYDVNQYEAPIVTAQLTEGEINALRQNDNVAMVEDDAPCYALGDYAFSGPFAHLAVENQPSPLAETIPAGVQQVNAPQAWGYSQGKGIRVAVVDTGIDFTHPDLRPNYVGGASFVPGVATPMDDQGHGTHCAGTIAAAIEGSNVVGVAPQASLYGVKVLDRNGSGQFSWIIAGIDWCIQNGMHVVSMSLGGSSAPTALETMCNTAWDKGLLLVAAAGNSNRPPNLVPPATSNVGFPAKYRNVIAVSAIDSANDIASFSSRGPEVDLCAPGVNVLSDKLGGGTTTMSGTSMACPHVAGVAALAWGSHLFSNNEQIWNLLAFTVDNLGVPGWDMLFGYGRVNALAAASAMVPPPAVPKRGV